MPTQTFFNLPEKKRKKIIDCAIDEFSAHSFKAASINRIVKNAGIAKGSLYQYFKDKKELYLYLIQLAGEIKLNYLDQNIVEQDDFFSMIEKIIIASSKFNLENPKFSQLVVNMLESSNDPFPNEIFGYLKQASQQWLQERLISAQKKKEIRTDIKIDLLSYVANKIIIDFGNFIIDKYNLSYTDLSNDLSITEKEIKEEVGELIKLLKKGIGVF